jgi:hypothetical protein
LGKCGLKVFHDFLSDDVGIEEIGAVFEAFVFESQGVEVEFVGLLRTLGWKDSDFVSSEFCVAQALRT